MDRLWANKLIPGGTVGIGSEWGITFCPGAPSSPGRPGRPASPPEPGSPWWEQCMCVRVLNEFIHNAKKTICLRRSTLVPLYRARQNLSLLWIPVLRGSLGLPGKYIQQTKYWCWDWKNPTKTAFFVVNQNVTSITFLIPKSLQASEEKAFNLLVFIPL